MKLIKEIIQRRMEILKDYGLNNDIQKELWSFYEIYKICINYLGIKDNKMNNKNKLLRDLIQKPEDIKIINKLKQYQSEDSIKIEMVLNLIEEKEEIREVENDFYPEHFIGVQIYDRT
jgi:hypothetical protein